MITAKDKSESRDMFCRLMVVQHFVGNNQYRVVRIGHKRAFTDSSLSSSTHFWADFPVVDFFLYKNLSALSVTLGKSLFGALFGVAALSSRIVCLAKRFFSIALFGVVESSLLACLAKRLFSILGDLLSGSPIAYRLQVLCLVALEIN